MSSLPLVPPEPRGPGQIHLCVWHLDPRKCFQSGCWLPSAWEYFSVDNGNIPGDFSLRAVSSLGGFSLSATGPSSPEWNPGPWGTWAAEPDQAFLSPLLCYRMHLSMTLPFLKVVYTSLPGRKQPHHSGRSYVRCSSYICSVC